jgi:hypothetical protein
LRRFSLEAWVLTGGYDFIFPLTYCKRKDQEFGCRPNLFATTSATRGGYPLGQAMLLGLVGAKYEPPDQPINQHEAMKLSQNSLFKADASVRPVAEGRILGLVHPKISYLI